MDEIKFDLGKNMVETAKASGVPHFQTRDVNGYVSYSITNVPPTIVAHYTRPGYEIYWNPIFGFRMYSNRKRNPDLPVETVALSLNSNIESHEAAQAFAEQTIAQFQRGKWQRFYDPEWDTLLTGRSSLLDESGKITSTLMTIDPAYKIPQEDWPIVAKGGAYWRWVGDGVIAQLSVTQLGSNGQPEDNRPLDYRFHLEFELFDVAVKRDARNLAESLKEGDLKGWNSTVKHESEKKARKEQLKRLEANAIKRGDSVVSPH